jgi:hypothetical protein
MVPSTTREETRMISARIIPLVWSFPFKEQGIANQCIAEPEAVGSRTISGLSRSRLVVILEVLGLVRARDDCKSLLLLSLRGLFFLDLANYSSPFSANRLPPSLGGDRRLKCTIGAICREAL